MAFPSICPLSGQKLGFVSFGEPSPPHPASQPAFFGQSLPDTTPPSPGGVLVLKLHQTQVLHPGSHLPKEEGWGKGSSFLNWGRASVISTMS